MSAKHMIAILGLDMIALAWTYLPPTWLTTSAYSFSAPIATIFPLSDAAVAPLEQADRAVAATAPAPGTFIQGVTAQGTSVQVTPGATWQQVATLQGPVASDLGLPAGQPMNVFCAPTGSQNPQGQPTSYQPGQPNPGQTNPAQAPLPNPPGQIGPQNPAPGQQ